MTTSLFLVSFDCFRFCISHFSDYSLTNIFHKRQTDDMVGGQDKDHRVLLHFILFVHHFVSEKLQSG